MANNNSQSNQIPTMQPPAGKVFVMDGDPPAVLSLPVEHRTFDATILEQLIDLYLERQLTDGVITQATHRIYVIQLRPFRVFWQAFAEEHRFRLSKALLAAAYDWIRHEYVGAQGRRLAYTTVEDCFVRLRAVFHWMYNQNCTGATNLARWCPDIKHVDPDQYFPTIEETERLLAQPAGRDRLRDVAIMAFLISTGARRNEASLAIAGDVEFVATPVTDLTLGHDHRGTCHLRITKGDREGVTGGRTVVFCSTAGLLLKAYFRSVNRQPKERIFGITDVAIGAMVQRHTVAAGVPEISPHAFRRMFSDYWNEKLPELEKLRKHQMGHALTAQDVTNRRYTNNKNKRRIVNQLLASHVSPLAEMRIDWTGFPVHIPQQNG